MAAGLLYQLGTRGRASCGAGNPYVKYSLAPVGATMNGGRTLR